MATDTSGIVMVDRLCVICGRVFRVKQDSTQQWCSDFCKRKDDSNPKWKTWQAAREQFEQLERRIEMGNGRFVDGCVNCGKPMLTMNRMGTCVECRTVKCAHPNCQNTLVTRGAARGYCRDHTYKTRRRESEISL